MSEWNVDIQVTKQAWDGREAMPEPGQFGYAFGEGMVYMVEWTSRPVLHVDLSDLGMESEDEVQPLSGTGVDWGEFLSEIEAITHFKPPETEMEPFDAISDSVYGADAPSGMMFIDDPEDISNVDWSEIKAAMDKLFKKPKDGPQVGTVFIAPGGQVFIDGVAVGSEPIGSAVDDGMDAMAHVLHSIFPGGKIPEWVKNGAAQNSHGAGSAGGAMSPEAKQKMLEDLRKDFARRVEKW